MKKKILAVVVCLVMISMVGVAGANTVRQDCGCGLGGMALADKEGFLWNMVGTLLNGLCGNQTFAMSTGTLDCGAPKKFATNDKVNVFVSDNMDVLAVDIAQGRGESLDALAEIAEVPAVERPTLYAALQNNFDTIYPNAQVTSTEVVAQISRIMQTI
jgi:hypothetical protein